MSISSQNPLVLLLPVLTIYFTLRRAQQRASITDLSQQMKNVIKMSAICLETLILIMDTMVNLVVTLVKLDYQCRFKI